MRIKELTIPFPSSYWVIPDLLLAGEFPGAIDPREARQKLESLFNSGILHVINLMESDETDHTGNPFSSYEKTLNDIAEKQGSSISCERYPIKDLNIPDLDQMTQIPNAIDKSKRLKRVLFYVNTGRNVAGRF